MAFHLSVTEAIKVHHRGGANASAHRDQSASIASRATRPNCDSIAVAVTESRGGRVGLQFPGIAVSFEFFR
jgi:hypothetical protein